jgi:hypothetical protein
MRNVLSIKLTQVSTAVAQILDLQVTASLRDASVTQPFIIKVCPTLDGMFQNASIIKNWTETIDFSLFNEANLGVADCQAGNIEFTELPQQLSVDTAFCQQQRISTNLCTFINYQNGIFGTTYPLTMTITRNSGEVFN